MSTAAHLADLVREMIGPGHVTTRETFRRGREAWTWRTSEPPYLVQLGEAIRPSGSPGWGADGALAEPRHIKPGSCWPVRADALNLILRIRSESGELRRELRTAAGRSMGPRLTATENLREIVGLAATGGPQTAEEALRAVRGWVYACRLVLGYDTPVVGLQATCYYCGQPSLRVRADASGAVWCSTPDCLDDDGYRPRWPREEWLTLLDQLTADAS